MRIRPITIVVLCVVSLATAAPAHAWLGDGWFERLSGAGPFRGLSIDLRLLCLASPDAPPNPTLAPAGEKNMQQMLADNNIGRAGTFPKRADAGAWVTVFGCHFLTRDEQRLEIGVQYNRMSAKGEENLLDYSHRPGLTPEDEDVRFNSFMLTADLRVNRIVDVGAAIGRGSFSSPADLFSSFSKLVFEPVRVTVRPLSTVLKNNRLVEAFLIRGTGRMFKGGFSDVEFGARPGSYFEPGEIVWGWTLIFDVSTAFWAK